MGWQRALEIYPQVGFTFKSVIMDNPLARDIDSVGAVLLVVIVQVPNRNQPDIGAWPYQDGRVFPSPKFQVLPNYKWIYEVEKRAVK